ncbi:MAG TPA: Rieske 2Fe-2S domain-containing protein [Roseiflexaceae bacterium]|jgi:Rieske Fe-S protein|nr:Rieske 2Fe-2S domain-containing protein [Roseiflexaceae bacterium]
MTNQEHSAWDTGGHSDADDQVKRWRAQFPYHWDADDLVSRRQFLQFVVYTSGALFGSTTLLALLGLIQKAETTAPMPVARMSEVPEGGALYFHYPNPDDQAMLLHLPGGRFVAYSQKCTHLSCAVYYQADRQRVYCPCHDGVFDPQTGEPTAGPPQRRLPQILLRQEGDQIFAVGVEA